jgi:transcriptional regulator with PAS, ATPase and Fis domain
MEYAVVIEKKNVENNIEFNVKVTPVVTPEIEYRQGTSLWFVQKAYVLKALMSNKGHRSNTADELCICRRTLQKYITAMRKEGMSIPEYKRIGNRTKRGPRPITIDTY